MSFRLTALFASAGGMVTDVIPGPPSGFVPGSQIAGYLLKEQIGQGGMAVVFRAQDERLNRTVALKILAPALADDEAFRQRFSRESKAAAAVDHPHIIPVFEAGEAGGALFIAMRFVSGGDAHSLISQNGPLPSERAAEIVSQVASALDAAHANGLVHRDVKPANMLLDASAGKSRPDHVYLSDFGLTKVSMQASALTGTGMVLGTLDYISPEQITGRPVNGRTDQYALACAAFELLTGAVPFARDEAISVMYAQLSETPPTLTSRRPDLPLAADEVFVRALAKDPADRYRSCGEFADALREALQTQRTDPGQRAELQQPDPIPTASVLAPPSTKPIPAGHAHARRSRRGMLAVAGAAIVVVAAAAAALALGLGGHGQHPEQNDGNSGTGGNGNRVHPIPQYAFVRVLADPPAGSNVIEGLAFSPDGKTLAVADNDGGTYLWDATTGRVRRTIAGPGSYGPALAVAFSPEGSTLAAAYKDGVTRLWDAGTGRLIRALSDPRTGGRGVQAVAFSPDGTTLATGDSNGSAYLWDLQTGAMAATLSDPDSGGNGVQAVAFSPAGRTLATGDSNGSSYLWNLASQRVAVTLAVAQPGQLGILALSFSRDGASLAAGDNAGHTNVWNVARRKLVATLADPGTTGFGAVAVAFSPDPGNALAVGDGNGTTYLWNLRTRRIASRLTYRPSRGVQAVAFSRAGRVLAIGEANGSTYLWQAR
jgi:serine/threonine protein kinase